MKDDYIIPDQEKKKVKKGLGKKAGYRFIIKVDSEDLPEEVREEITIDDIVAICRVNGESIEEERKKPGHMGPSREGEARGTGNKGRDSEKGKGKSGRTGSSREGKARGTGYTGSGSSGREGDSGYIGGGYGGSGHTGTDNQTPKSKPSKEKQEDKDEDEKKKKVFLGKAVRIGSSLLAATILIGAIATTRVERRETEIQRGDKANVESVSDILTTEIEGETITIPGSVIKNPGELISAQKDRYEGEIQVTDEGREQFESETPEKERVRQEDEIMKITQEFNEQQKIIHDAEEVIQDPNATDEEKKAAIERMTEAKKEELRIYKENEQLFKEYNEKAKKAYSIGGGDERTEGEVERATIELTEYGMGMRNLEMDIISLSSTLGVLEDPEVLFDEVAPDAGTTTEKYVIDMELFGKPVKIWQSEKKFYISVDYDTDVQTSLGHQVDEGVHVVTADELAELESTYKDLHAVVRIIGRVLGHEHIGKVSVFGQTIFNDQDGPEDSEVEYVDR